MGFLEGKIINGHKFAKSLYKLAHEKLDELKREHNFIPGLAIIRVGDHEASRIYVANKLKKAQECGLNASEYHFKHDISQKVLNAKIEHLNNDHRVNGIIVQLPLPKQIDATEVINLIDPDKDVDGFSIQNVGRLHTWQDCLEPCTPTGTVMVLKRLFDNDLSGLKVCIIGRSLIVGRPLAGMLLRESCTVKILHSKSVNLPSETIDADVIISAVGSPNMIKSSWIKSGACIIDVGITRDEATGKLHGDVDFDDVIDKVSFITPVPGGVGPITVACLILNTLKAAYIQKKIKL